MADLTPGVGNPPKPRPNPLQTIDYPGFSLGMFPDIPKFEIPDGGLFYAQDVIFDRPNIARQRGPLIPTSAGFSAAMSGGIVTYRPDGVAFIGIVGGGVNPSTPPSFTLCPADMSSNVTRLFGGVGLAARFVLASPAVANGGAFIGAAEGWDVGSRQVVMLWKGNSQGDYTTGTVSVTAGSTTVTGVGTLWSSNAGPGMFLLTSAGQPVGSVLSVNSDTSITLEQAALRTLTGSAYKLTAVRGFWPMATVGEITCSTSSASITGSNTKFLKHGLNTGTWDLYRLRDLKFIGQVASVSSDTSMALTGNATINCSVDNYLCIRSDVNWGTAQNATTYGWITASYAGRQFFANKASSTPSQAGTVWFSAENLPEAIDISAEDGDFIPVSSGSARSANSPIKGMAAGFHSLLILKDNEAFALTGSVPEQFQVDKVYDDGTLSGHSVQTWQDNVIWAGRGGIYAWDGTAVTNLISNNLRVEYQKAIKSISNTVAVNSALVRDHYMLYVSSVDPTYGPAKGGTSVPPSSWTIVINLKTGAVSFWTNSAILFSLQLPFSSSPQFFNTSTYIVAQKLPGSLNVIIPGDPVFDTVGTDTFGTGPNFYLESKRYSLGAALRRKLIKQIAMHYKSIGSGLSIDTMVGINTDTSTTNTTSFPATSDWDKKRYKFLKHDNFVAFRIYPTGTATEIQIGPFELGFKTQAPGRI